jgi:hypothetical protein
MDDLGLTDLSFDLDKAICIDTIEYFYEQAMNAFETHDSETLCQSLTYVCYISLIKKEH